MLDGLNNAMEYPDTKMAKAEYLNPEDLTLLQNEESLSLLQSNFSSSSCHLEELHTLFNESNLGFETIGIAESWIRHSSKPFENVILPGYNIDQTHFEISNG